MQFSINGIYIKILKKLGETIVSNEEIDESTEVRVNNIAQYCKVSENLEDNNDYWLLMLLYLIWMQEHENEKLWKKFKEDIKHNSRFFPRSELLEKVDNVSVYATAELSMGTILYRAREYKNDDYLKNKEVVAVYEKLNELFPDMQLQLEDVNSDSVMSMISFFLYGEMSKIQELRHCITETEIREKPFWGFNEKDCDAPPKEQAKAGRANSAGIRFLYAASDKKTAIMEMRPQNGQYFNVCKIILCRNILLFDFTYKTNEMKENEFTKSGDLYAISKEFSYPNYGIPEDYIPTQYLCEYLRQKGFDGIKYKSAVSPTGTNLIIFDTDSSDKAYEIVESRVYEVENIDIQFEQIIPIEPDRFQDKHKSDT